MRLLPNQEYLWEKYKLVFFPNRKKNIWKKPA